MENEQLLDDKSWVHGASRPWDRYFMGGSGGQDQTK